ncbi:hypothetical protein Hanom_Chr16g01475301 [Helianthus anomalus]
MITVICDNREQEVCMLENIMTKQGLGFLEELHNTTCLNKDMNIKLALLQDMFKWRLQKLQEREDNESESDDLDEKLEEESEEEDEGSDGHFLDKVLSDEEF